ncbi:cytidine deaminase [Fervidicoccus fontis]|uniref:cytidine deaminase n=1 Tax=Fervidicoccus fontis TaxID=683846 RepID=A0A843ACP4_9CREN|nr:cytidine deaminase [Fervidicoccus fontis]MBE9391774.1 cytidine deaminase [Fervidicoccus fontis]
MKAISEKINLEKLLAIAKDIIKNSYSPYSHFPVAAVVKTKKGNIYTGVNIENASYGLSICAERVAIFKAVSEGDREIEILLVYTPTKQHIYPCGACRQVILEFNPNALVIIANKDGISKSARIKDLLPMSFSKRSLRSL